MNRRPRLDRLPPLPDEPVVTVVMPIRNEARYIGESLGDVLAQDYPAELMEVLVCDGDSDDDTVAIVQRTAHAHPENAVRILRNERRIPPAALNQALGVAQGDLVIRIDGHCRIPPEYVRRLVELSKATGAACVGGHVVTTGVNAVSSAIAAAQGSRFGVGGAAFRMSDEAGPVDTVLFGAYRREVFEVIGGFYEELLRSEDDEFNLRLTLAGGVIWMDPSVSFTHFARPDFRSLWRQYYGYGRHKPRAMQMHRTVVSLRHLVPSAFVLGLAGTLALGAATRRPAIAGAVAVPYLAATTANAVRSARECAASGGTPVSVRSVAVATTVLHLSYGTGAIEGFLRLRSQGHPPPPTIRRTGTDPVAWTSSPLGQPLQPVPQAGGTHT
jgi:succinoglycan biosynthesis protein ExoA